MKRSRRCFILIFYVFLAVAAINSTAQQALKKTVTLRAEQVPLVSVIEQIQQQAGISFFYSLNAIGANRKVSCTFDQVPLKRVLDDFFASLNIRHKIIDNQIILYTRTSPSSGQGVASGKESGQVEQQRPSGVTETEGFVLNGKVVQQDSLPIAGVSVVVSGTHTGTITNDDGYFRLEGLQASGKIELSHAAYQSFSLIFSASVEPLHIQLQPEIMEMDEVMVIGYGVQSRRSSTTATATVKGSSIADAPVSTADAALQGRAAGVFVTQQGGSPGSPVRIQVRGTSSISSGTEPLYIVDGIYIFQELNGLTDAATSSTINPLAAINPDDIASIEILKDAAAAAIYGARGANGVILITTKNAKKGQGSFSVSLNKGLTSPIRLKEYATGHEWLKMVDEARQNTVGFGIIPAQVTFDPFLLVSNTLPTPAGISGPLFMPNTAFTRELAENTNTNWIDPLLQPGGYTDIKMAVSNGFAKGSIYLSGQYWDEDGILLNQRLQRFVFRSNIEFNPAPKWRFGAKLSPSLIKSNFAPSGVGGNGSSLGRNNVGATGGWAQANLGALPIMPVYHPDGSYFDPMRGRNAVAGADAANFSSRQNQHRFIGNLFAEFKPHPVVTFRAESGGDFLVSQGVNWVSDVIRYNRMAGETTDFINNLSGTIFGTYMPALGRKHELTTTMGVEWQQSTFRSSSFDFEAVTGNQQEIGEIDSGQQTLTAVSGIYPDHRFISSFLRATYAFDSRYFFSASLRRDGSSVFTPSNRFGYFPALSSGWILSEERWFQNMNGQNTISLLKLRASYGQTGNAAIPAFAYRSNFVNWPVYGQSAALSLSVLGNPNIRWEKNNQVDAALEIGLWNNRMHTSIGGFVRTSADMLLNVPVAPTVGIGAGNQSVIVNIGNLRNTGIEWELNGVIVENYQRRNQVRWSIDANVTWISDKVLSLTESFRNLPSGDFPVAAGIQQGVGITRIGGRLGTFYLAEFAGLDNEGFETIFEVDKEILRTTGRTVRTGKVLRATNTNISNNRMVLENKTGLPRWFGGVTQSWQWRGFDVRMHVSFQGGNYIYDGHEESVSYVRTGNNVLLATLSGNNWSHENPRAPFPRLTWNLRDNTTGSNGEPLPQTMGTRTTRFLYRGDFVRLKTLSVSYTLPSAWIRILRLQSAKMYVSGQNLFTFTAYPGFDPEILISGPGSQARNLNQGFLTLAPVPQVVTIMVGMNLVL